MDRCSIKRDMNLKLSDLDQSEGLGASWTAASPGTLLDAQYFDSSEETNQRKQLSDDLQSQGMESWPLIG